MEFYIYNVFKINKYIDVCNLIINFFEVKFRKKQFKNIY